MSFRLSEIDKDTLRFMEDIYSLKLLVRYANTPRIKDETVAEHSAFVTLTVLKLHERFNFDLQKAMIMAITHDLPETYTSDIPHPVKRAFPMLDAALMEAEDFAWKKFPEKWKTINDEMRALETPEALIVTIADVLSCVQYTAQEVALGNTAMRKVMKTSIERINVLLDTLLEMYPHVHRTV